jgi:hypothetical protein
MDLEEGRVVNEKERAAEPRRRKPSGPTPTSRTLEWCRKNGWMASVVEKWVPKARIRQDLFDCIDIVACTPGGIVGIQTTSASNHAARRTKAQASEKMAAWCRSGGKFWVVSWGGLEMRKEEVHCG